MPQELKSSIHKSLVQARQALDDFLGIPAHLDDIQKMADRLADCFRGGNKILICGNGGSACDALHFAEECTGRFRKDRAALPVIPLMESGHMTCVSNDYGFEHVFARGVEAYGRPGDILMGISTSGNSPNVIRAAETARKAGLQVLLFLGKDGGALKGFGDGEIWVRCATTERVQEVHMTVLHILVESVERRLFPGNYAND